MVCLLIFGVRQRRLARGDGSPLLDLRPFGYPMFSLSVTMLCIAIVSLFGMVILLPIYLQTIRGIGSLPTGLMLLPGGLLMGLLGPTVGQIFDRHGPKALCTGGAAALTFTLWRFSTVDAATPIWMLVGLHVLMMVALAFLFTPASPRRSTRCRPRCTHTAAPSWPPRSRSPAPPALPCWWRSCRRGRRR